MTSASPWRFPDPRTVADWCRGRSFQAAWLACLRVFHLEVLVQTAATVTLGRFEQQVLAAFHGQEPSSLQRLEDRLHLPPPLLTQVLQRLASARLVVHDIDSSTFALTSLGLEAHRVGKHPCQIRRSFAFVERPDLPHFLDLAAGSGQPCNAAAFDHGLLEECLRQPADWKARHGFPLDVQSLPPQGSLHAVPYVLAEELCVFVVTGDSGKLEAHCFRDSGQLDPVPVFTLDSDWPEVLPQLKQVWSSQHAQQGWDEWSQAAGLDQALPESIELAEGRLRVTLPDTLAEPVRAAAVHAPWALVGAQRVRTLAAIDIVTT